MYLFFKTAHMTDIVANIHGYSLKTFIYSRRVPCVRHTNTFYIFIFSVLLTLEG